ncbi:hypothetical protein ACOTTU_01095 [Roseobacter sp. EG26]|uniref:hypothetical protein n=1 Tax=Roseobacter sp. EG26 TaxID=3412477 RepID=UPI003CE56C61
MRNFLETRGFWQHSDNNYYAVTTTMLSDRATGRHAKVAKLWLLGTASDGLPMSLSTINTQSGSSWTNNGALNYNTNPITANDITQRVDVDGSVTINVATLSSAAGTGHSSFSLADLDGVVDFIGAKRGRLTVVDAAATTVTYTPAGSGSPIRDDNFTDEVQVFLHSEGRYKTVKINFLIVNTDAGITTPVVDTHFAASDSATANAIDVQMIAKPDTSGRRIVRTEYSTDAGTTCKRLSNGWQPMTVPITTESEDTAIAVGSYNVRLRYKTDYDYDYVTSSASADDAVTVS